MTLLRRLLRLFRRPRPSPAPPASGAPAANPDGGTWLPVDEAIAAWNGEDTLTIVMFNATSKAEPKGCGYVWIDANGKVVSIDDAPDGAAMFLANEGHPARSPVDPLDAIAARFDVRVDAVLRARSSKEVPATGDAG